MGVYTNESRGMGVCKNEPWGIGVCKSESRRMGVCKNKSRGIGEPFKSEPKGTSQSFKSELRRMNVCKMKNCLSSRAIPRGGWMSDFFKNYNIRIKKLVPKLKLSYIIDKQSNQSTKK